MTKEQIQKMQEYFNIYYPKLNNWWCWLFAYSFVSRIWGIWLKLWHPSIEKQVINSSWVQKELSWHHFIVSYEWKYFDWLEYIDDIWSYLSSRWYVIVQECDKQYLAVAILEWWWNPTFYRNNFSSNPWECMYDFIYNFESQLDKQWVKYTSRL